MTEKVKIAIFDVLYPMPMGAALHHAFQNNDINSLYINAKKMPTKSFYKIKRAIAKKLFFRRNPEISYYYHAKRNFKEFKDAMTDFRPDICLILNFIYPFIDKEKILQLKKELGFKLVLYDAGSGNMFTNPDKTIFFIKYELPIYDQIISFSERMVAYWKSLNLDNISFFPYGANIIERSSPTTKEHDLLFVGEPDMRRVILTQELCQYNIKIFGQKWRKFFPIISEALKTKITPENIWNEELHQLISRSKIILNINIAPWHAIETGSNLRVFEALSAGAFLLTDYSEELEQMFAIGKEIETYKTIEELHDKIGFYLTHDQEREEIAARGHKKFLDQFTWEQRAACLIDTIK